jgi:hypothetical protein
MKTVITVVAVAGALVLCAADVYAMGGGGGGRSRALSVDTTTGPNNASVPEPSALYAIGSGLALLGGAGWYIRRRK